MGKGYNDIMSLLLPSLPSLGNLSIPGALYKFTSSLLFTSPVILSHLSLFLIFHFSESGSSTIFLPPSHKGQQSERGGASPSPSGHFSPTLPPSLSFLRLFSVLAALFILAGITFFSPQES